MDIKTKADISIIGFIAKDGTPQGFCFDCKGKVAGVETQEDGTCLYGGWTVKELEQLIEDGG